MPTRTIHTLAPELAAKMPEVARRVLGEGGSTATTPYGGGHGRQLWFIISSEADDGTNVSRWNYTGRLYATPASTSAISSTSVLARNAYEALNVSSFRGGLAVNPSSTTCGDVTGISPARRNVPYPVVGRRVIAGVTYYLFAHPNDPIVRGP